MQRTILTHVYMASVEELDQVDSGMGSSDARSPEVKSLLPEDGDEDDEEVWTIIPSLSIGKAADYLNDNR